MAKIKIKRGMSTNLPTLTLDDGELAVALDTGKLYVGYNEEKVLINPDQASSETAVKLQTARTISLTGDATGSASFDGSANAPITVVLANSGATAGTYTKLTIDAKGRVTGATQITAADIPNLTIAKITDAGTAAKANTGVASGNVPLIGANGKLDAGIMPAITISDTFVVATQAAMLALIVEVGDIAVRTDVNKTFILRTAGASTLANWQEMLTPTAAVQSVAGKTGAVTLVAADVGLANVTNESKATMFASAALTGNSTAVTQAIADNSTKIATTEHVKAQGYITAASDIDGGTF